MLLFSFPASDKERLASGTRSTIAIAFLFLVVVTTGKLLTPFFPLAEISPHRRFEKGAKKVNVG